jgi:hypothetical protein
MSQLLQVLTLQLTGASTLRGWCLVTAMPGKTGHHWGTKPSQQQQQHGTLLRCFMLRWQYMRANFRGWGRHSLELAQLLAKLDVHLQLNPSMY